ncbi:hypothetical protein [Serratia proteamaculans]|uniref:hypothetical protein n=1 Tax=Serratia proteamaculans TaxID=28151 RepID=UPI002178E955|nr:hypothetical protein [Serratia proteamaculans]CAI0906124.1 Uncharacterised protein [Serratia proteamaculans]CAI0967459.1 Uncharacterised protein [Serratia proteamaculans]
MKKIYLDYNVFLGALERGENEFISYLKGKGYQFIYSPAHIEEVARGIECGKVSITDSLKNLDGIGSITENLELFPYHNDKLKPIESPYGKKGIQLIKESPADCFKRVYDNIESNIHAEESQKSVIMDGHNKFSSLSNIERDRALDKINKLDPVTEILMLNEKKEKLIGSFISLQSKADATEELLKSGRIKHPFNKEIIEEIDNLSHYKIMSTNGYYDFIAREFLSNPNKCFYKIKSVFSFIENMIDVVMRELMRHGYKLEGIKKSESSLHDHTHSIYATACDYFISGDNRLASKTNAAYLYLGVNTKVINANKKNWWIDL